MANKKELHELILHKKDVTDGQCIALTRAITDFPVISTLDLRHNRLSNDVSRTNTVISSIF